MCGGPNGICIGRLEHVKLGFGCSPNWENGKKLEGKKLPKRTKTIKMCCVRESPNSMPQIQPSLARVQGRTKKNTHGNLVDSASSHTLVSKIKPCMSECKYHTLELRTAHYISYSLFDSPLLLG